MSSSCTYSPALASYAPAFEGARASDKFVTYYSPQGADKRLLGTDYTRGEFWELAKKAALVLQNAGLKKGDAHVQMFSANMLGDLVFRLASVFLGTIPVTVNWEADTPEKMVYKAKITGAKLIVYDDCVAPQQLEYVRSQLPSIAVFDVAGLHEDRGTLPETAFCNDKDLDGGATRIVIFTSGTTGDPKGVELAYRSYDTNRGTFEQFLEVTNPETPFTAVCTNPMHHTNSTAITDWSLRRPGARLLLVQRYTTNYWELLALAGCPDGTALRGDEAINAAVEARKASGMRVVAPLVSKHFDFLDSLASSGKLPLAPALMRKALSDIVLLVGSAPVGPTTVERLQLHCGTLPTVRFGSTETCLQVIGTLLCLSAEQRLNSFKAGWSHQWKGEPLCGYYVGRPHPGFTESKVVVSVDKSSPDYLKECELGQPGQLVTRGGHVMKGYVGLPEKTAEVMDAEGWYLNLGDICFCLRSADDGQLDYYWQGRDSALLIKGGSNYSYEQINAELKKFLAAEYKLADDEFDLAVVGLRLHSEHEDDCVATIELKSDAAKSIRSEMESTIMVKCKNIKKSNKPDHVRFAPIPRNFKGACEVKVLKKDCEADIKK